jgi:hypothetical protein
LIRTPKIKKTACLFSKVKTTVMIVFLLKFERKWY